MEIITFGKAIDYLGISDSTLRRLHRDGEIASVGLGTRLQFLVEDLEELKQKIKPAGLTHAQIADRFGRSRQQVERRFRAYHVKVSGFNRYGGKVYDEATIKIFATLFGWVERPPESQKDEPQTPQSA